MKLLTNELVPRFFLGDPDDILLMLRLTSPYYAPSNAVYMACANRMMVEQGRVAVDTTDERTFLEALAQQGLLRIEGEEL